MPRALRLQYPGASYHVRNRGDRRVPKGEVRQSARARRLRAETTMTLKGIAQRLHLSTWTPAANRLQHANRNQLTTNPNELNLL